MRPMTISLRAMPKPHTYIRFGTKVYHRGFMEIGTVVAQDDEGRHRVYYPERPDLIDDWSHTDWFLRSDKTALTEADLSVRGQGVKHDPVEEFYQRVNLRAESTMLRDQKITGAHHRALEAEIALYRRRDRELD